MAQAQLKIATEYYEKLTVENERIETASFGMWRQNDIVYLKYKNVMIDLQVMKIVQEAYYALSAGDECTILSDGRDVKYWTKEARAYHSEILDAKYMKALAVVTDSFVMQTLINFYLYYDKPIVPVKIFMDEKKAVAWLNTYKTKK